MMWSDVKNFTYAELSFFTWQELNSSTIELYSKYKNSNLPSSISMKLLELSQEFVKDNPELALKINKSNSLTLSDFITLISIFISVPVFYNENKFVIDDLISKFISIFSK